MAGAVCQKVEESQQQAHLVELLDMGRGVGSGPMAVGMPLACTMHTHTHTHTHRGHMVAHHTAICAVLCPGPGVKPKQGLAAGACRCIRRSFHSWSRIENCVRSHDAPGHATPSGAGMPLQDAAYGM